MLDVRKLRLLRELSYRGTIAAVAEAMSYTPSAVSQQLSALEGEAGRALLIRTGRSVALTHHGTVLVAHAEVVLGELERARAALLDDADLAGVVRLGTFPTALPTIVLPALDALARRTAALTIEVTEIDPAAAPDLLRGDHLDVALIHEYDNVPSTVGAGVDLEPLLDEVVFFASTSAPDVGPADLVRAHAASPWIVGNPGTLCHTMAVRSCQASGFEPRVAHRIDDFTTVLRMVAAGRGVALVPQLGVSELPAGVVMTPLPMRRRTRIAVRRGSGDRPALVAVAEELRRAAEVYINA